jgi:hypothetical protein
VIVLKLRGHQDQSDASALQELLRSLFGWNHHVIVDLTDATVGEPVMEALLDAKQAARRSGVTIEIYLFGPPSLDEQSATPASPVPPRAPEVGCTLRRKAVTWAVVVPAAVTVGWLLESEGVDPVPAIAAAASVAIISMLPTRTRR